MAWVKGGTDTLSGVSDTMQALCSKKFINAFTHNIASGSHAYTTRMSANTGSNYSNRRSDNGAADATDVSQTSIGNGWGGTTEFVMMFIANISGEEKLMISHVINQGTAGAANAPNRRENAAKFTVTAGQITSVDGFNNGAGDFAADSNLTALGTD